MIGFFRRIRKKLADDNQFLKYSRYAIGEIVLVVIGILIALQINNWNENRKEKNQSIFYHQQLINDLQIVISSLETDARFPSVNRLKSAKGTPAMPKPNEAAILLSEAFDKALQFESGSYIDIREL